MPHGRAAALDEFTAALWRAWTRAGPVSFGDFEKLSRKVLGPAQCLPASTVHGNLRDPRRRQPPRWEWVLRFWEVLRVVAADHGVDPDSLGTLAELKHLHEAADPSQRPAWQLAGVPGGGSRGPVRPGVSAGYEPGARSVLWRRGFSVSGNASVLDDEVLAETRRKVGVEWWHDYSDVVPGWFAPYLSLEPAASLIQVYDTAVVPNLLQTEAYADAVLRLGPCILPEATIARIVELRMRRQHILDQLDSRKLWAIIDESAFRRRLGTRAVTRGQLRHLIDTTAKPNVTIQVIPSATAIRTTLGYPITLLRFRVHEVPDVAYIEQLTSALYIHEYEQVSRYGQVLDGLVLEALAPAESADYLSRLLRGF